MQARLLRELRGHDGTEKAAVTVRDHDGKERKAQITRHRHSARPAGTVIDHPEAFRLVQLGVAEPLDEACVRAAGMTPEAFEAAKAAAERAALGIHPDDFEAHAAGAMAGYDADGNWVPGPNFDAWVEAHSGPEADERE
jgi:hypothetical protein